MLARLFALFMTLMTLGEGVLSAYADEMNLGGYLFLVNRSYTISSDYEPQDLVSPNVKKTSSSTLMRADAAKALEQLFSAAKEEKGYTLVAVSGYRSYQTQSAIFSRKVKNVGRAQALLLVAPPGASEHQLGLAMDIGSSKNNSLSGSFGNTEEGKWVAQNAHRFGFIIRYKAEWTDVTGYAYEPWHIRYVGVEHAERIFSLDIPFEEYIAQLRQAQYASLSEKLSKEATNAAPDSITEEGI